MSGYDLGSDEPTYICTLVIKGRQASSNVTCTVDPCKTMHHVSDKYCEITTPRQASKKKNFPDDQLRESDATNKSQQISDRTQHYFVDQTHSGDVDLSLPKNM